MLRRRDDLYAGVRLFLSGPAAAQSVAASGLAWFIGHRMDEGRYPERPVTVSLLGSTVQTAGSPKTLRKKVVVLLHEEDTAFLSIPYLIRLLMREWQQMGLEVEVTRGTEPCVKAEVLIPHLDITILPDEYRRYLQHHPVVINRHVIDISKTKISTNLLSRNDPYRGPVIVKTDRNYGGLPEQRFFSDSRIRPPSSSRLPNRVAAKLWRKLKGPISWRHVERLDPHTYPVFPSLREVPRGVFQNRELVVEKFLPEVDGDNYCVRCHYFFGNQDVDLLLRSKERIVKGDNAVRFDEAPPQPELYELRQQLGFEYGRFDYVLQEGRVVLFDVNRTPTAGALTAKSLAPKVARHLAKGIQHYLSSVCWIGLSFAVSVF